MKCCPICGTPMPDSKEICWCCEHDKKVIKVDPDTNFTPTPKDDK